ncbi:hypothetical protein HPB47_018516 [Ixodes persulcatus]|uniref:Uncharacterized protein n=1 Tax=Ixodes persulcatus TaxID=34615 RepID=A0AC60QP58_IXOPE|nr:hypothetical protein HPB47_018516 [Ixodes persulcatus]
MATFLASRRGSPKLCLEGYLYTKHRTNDEKTAWRCERFQEGCRGRAVTAGVRVCSEHFDGDRDYRRIGSVLRDAGQTVKRALLKSDAVPSLRLPPTVKHNISSMEDPATKRRKILDDQPIEELDFEVKAPREHDCHCRHRPTTRDAAVQADPQEKPQVPTPAVMKDSSVGTDARLGKRSVDEEEDDDDKEEEEEDDDDDPLYEPFSKDGFVENATTFCGEPGYNERKFLVFGSCLRELFAVCQTCYRPCSVFMRATGTLLTVRTSCPAGHSHRWESQPSINGRALGNLLISALVLFTGASPTNTLRLLRLMNVQVICSKTFFNYQRAILVPAVEQVWMDEQGKLLEELHDQPLDLAGDGRCDSPGYCAKYLTYSLHVPGVNKILHFEQVQVGESEAVRSSGLMEKEGLIRCLAFTRQKELSVQSLTTDRHRSIAKHMREKEPAVRHYFDVWHVSKSVKKGLSSASKSRDCGSIAEWVQPAVNHLYWCAVASQGDPDLLVGAWTSMTRHVVDIHTDHPGIYAQCLHDPDRDGDWLVPDSPAHARFTDVVANKSLLKDLRHLSPETQTTRIATLHWNENANREQAVTQAGQLQFKVKSPKARKGHHTAHPEKTKATHDYVTKLVAQAVAVCKEIGPLKEVFELEAKTPRLSNLTESCNRPLKEDLVAARISRFGKKPPNAAD